MVIIELKGMEFFAYHGNEPQERRDGNRFTVDFRAEANVDKAVETDCLSDTLDYGAVYSVVAREMEIPSNLLEHVAGRILKALKEQFPQIQRCSLRVSKHNPPVGGEVACSSVTLDFDRSLESSDNHVSGEIKITIDRD